MNRREFLRNSGALIVAFSSADVPGLLGQGRFDGPGTPQLDSWVAIAPDGSVTAYTGKVELGHGLLTAQTQLVAGLSVPFHLIQATRRLSRPRTTSGSQSHPVRFQRSARDVRTARGR
jgi:hypothetical protein